MKPPAPHLTRRFSLHEGGTKFYGVYLIHDGNSGRTVTVKMHGPWRGMEPFPRSLPASRYSIEYGRSIDAFHAAIKAKSSRGYKDWNGEGPREISLQDLRYHFSDSDAEAIVNYLQSGVLLEEAVAIDDEDIAPVAAPGYASAGNESWGSW